MRFTALIFSVLVVFAACAPLPETGASKLRNATDASTASAESQRVAAYYTSVQARLLSQGRLRQDYNPSDVRFSTQNLVANFERIALYDEYTIRNGHFIERQTPSSLRRWERPVRVGITFGPSVSPEQRAKDTASVRSFAARLARISGLDIQLTDAKSANFSFLFLNRDEQRDYLPTLHGQIRFLEPQIVEEIKASPRGIFCVAYAIEERGSLAGYTGAIILIKAEHSGLMRQSCIQEEMAQALGLANDSPKAKPSIFNDDEEFALLTRHDELLLRMLYDQRLKIGMTVKNAHPIVELIAQELMTSEQS